jgi:hydrogenase expression/formation protein HypE
MKIGKLNSHQLHHSVLSVLNEGNEHAQAKVGEDVAYYECDTKYLAFSTDPITGATKEIGSLAVLVSCNDVAAGGAIPRGILMTLLLPPNTTIEEIEEIARDAAQEAKKIGVEILGGHTEVTTAVTRPVISSTVFGTCDKVLPGVQVGDAIVLTKKIAMEATGILLRERANELAHLSEEERREGLQLAEQLSVLEEAKVAIKYGVNRMHDVTEGGLLGALSEMVIGRDIGFSIELDAAPLATVTKKIAEHFGLDVYQLISSGAMIISLEEQRAQGLLNALHEEGIEASVIGTFTEETDMRINWGGERIHRELKEVDEIYRVMG